MMKSVFSIVMAFMLAACVSSGSKFKMSDVDALRPGQTTISEAKSILGLPNGQTNNADGSTLLVWTYVTATPLGGESSGVSIIFAKDEKMIRVVTKRGNRTN